MFYCELNVGSCDLKVFNFIQILKMSQHLFNSGCSYIYIYIELIYIFVYNFYQI